MLSAANVGGDNARNKTHGDQVRQIHGNSIGIDQGLQDRIVTGKCLQDLPAVGLAHSGSRIMILHPAALAAELLVCASVFDLIAAFQTMRHPSDIFPVSHFHYTVMIDHANMKCHERPCKSRQKVFPFLKESFSFSERRRIHKKIHAWHKKI